MSLVFQNVSKSFGSRLVLNDVSFTANKGELLFILGKSGVGKSVTLKHCIGLLSPDSGKIWVDSFEVTSMHGDEALKAVRKLCGMIFQHPALLDSLTVFENIAFGLRHLSEERANKRAKTATKAAENGSENGNKKLSFSEMDKLVKTKLKQVHLDESILSKLPNEISVGMQKRVSIARTLAISPRYLLFDEPTTGLDPITTQAIHELIFELSRNIGVTSLVVSHDMTSALRFADRMIVLDLGQVIFDGTPKEILQSTHPLILDFLADCPNFHDRANYSERKNLDDLHDPLAKSKNNPSETH